MSVVGDIRAVGVIPVLRCRSSEDAVETGLACARGGLTVLEVTMTVPNALEAVAQLADRDGLVVGVGTVSDARQVGEAVDAGARFAVSFANPEGLVETGRTRDVFVVPGAMTPGEVAKAAFCGAGMVKVFPAGTLGTSYIRSLRQIMPDVEIMATGGLGSKPDELADWFASGVACLGIGSALGTVEGSSAAAVEARARAFHEAAVSARSDLARHVQC